MAGTIVINGRETGRPGVYAVPEFLRLQSRAPLSSILAIIGDFPFLEQNTPYLSTTQSAFDVLSFSNLNHKRLSNIIFDASNDPAVRNSPAGVYLVSPTATTQAFGYLQDVTPANTIKIKAKQWGLEGNRTHFSIVENATLGGWNFTARNGTKVESNVRIKAEPALMKLAYAEPAAGPTIPTGIGTVGGGDSGNVKLAVANGVVSTTFTQVIDDAFTYVAGGAVLSWDSDIPVDGVLTFNSGAADTIATGPLTIKVTGVNKDTGVSATTSITWTKIDIEAQTPKSTTIEYTGPVTVIFEYPVADPYTGKITITGNVFPDFSAANGQTYVGDVIRYIAGYSAVGFTTSTDSVRTSSAKLEDLDDLTAATLTDDLTTTNGILSADLWKIVTTINAKSLLVEAERLTTDKPPNLSTTPTSFFLAGGTETSAVAADWEAALEELRWYDIDVIAPLYDPTGTAATADTILPKLVDHIETMWSEGANERVAWFPAGDDETLSELTARATTFGNYRISLPVDGVSMVQYNNQVEDLLPYWTAVLMAAMDASTNGLIPLTWRSPRITSATRNSTLYSSEAVEEMIQSGLLFFTEPPGQLPQVERDITTYTDQDDPRRTERVAVRSLMLSLKFMRAALRPYIVSPDGSIATLSDIKGAVIQELERQRNNKVFKSFDADKVVITPYTDRYEVEYEFVPLYPINFIVLRAKVSAPTPIA